MRRCAKGQVNADPQDLDMQRVRLQTLEHLEQSIVSALQEQLVSQSEMAEQRDDWRRRQMIELTIELALAEGRSEDHRELNSAAIASADLPVENYRLELTAEQPRSRLSEMEGRQLTTHSQEEVDHHMRHSEWYREMVPAHALRRAELRGDRSPSPQNHHPDVSGPSPQPAGRGTAVRSDAARYHTSSYGRRWWRRLAGRRRRRGGGCGPLSRGGRGGGGVRR